MIGRQGTKPTILAIMVLVTAIAYLGVRHTSVGENNREPVSAALYRSISFDDLAPAGITLNQCWNAMGIDSRGRVYIGFTSSRSDGRQDFAVFRYDPSTGDRLFLGTFMGASEAAGNLESAEEIPKGHTRMIEIHGKMYMGSQGFHDFKNGIDTLPRYRGSHLYTFDLSKTEIEDVSRFLPGGIVTQHQGIVALSYRPEYNVLVALAHPSSDIVLLDYKHNNVQKVVPGVPWRLGNPLSREIVITKNGKIYTYRGTEDPANRDAMNRIWVYDLKTSSMTETAYTATGGFWNGQTWTRDGQTIYLSTVNGELYKLNVETEVFTHLAHFLPREDYNNGARVDYLYGISLSADEKRIYGIPRRSDSQNSNLYFYEIATGKVSLAGKLESAIYTGSHMSDSQGNIYFAQFGNEETWEGRAHLAIIHPSRVRSD